MVSFQFKKKERRWRVWEGERERQREWEAVEQRKKNLLFIIFDCKIAKCTLPKAELK